MAQPQTDIPMLRLSRPLECPNCQIPLRLLDRVWDIRARGYIRIFECSNCCRLVWEE